MIWSLGNCMFPTLWQQFGEALYKHDCAPVLKVRSIKTGLMSLVWRNSSCSDLNPTEQLGGELEHPL